MKILAHRGYWNDRITNNSPEALFEALKRGYGFESDIRDYEGKLVISHDIANADSQPAEEVFEWLRDFSDQHTFAVNIKADGLKLLLLRLLEKYSIKNYFVFDMSIPQLIEFNKHNMVFFTRQSEFEKDLVFYDKAAGVWIDGFFDDSWITESLLKKHIDCGKKVCLVSPELHKRSYQEFWSKISQFNIDFSSVFLCTDYPDEASNYFGNKVVR